MIFPSDWIAIPVGTEPAFEQAYAATYPTARELLEEIYDEVASGNEIRSVVMAGERLKRRPIGKIDRTETWKVGERVRAGRVDEKLPLNPFAAGVYVAVMMAQVDLLEEKGHPYSEIANESVIEADLKSLTEPAAQK